MILNIELANSFSKNRISNISISSDGRPRGCSKPINFNNNGIYIKKTGEVLSGNFSNSLNILIEGGNPNWEGAFVQEGIHPYYTPAQVSTLLNIVNFLKKINPSVGIDNNTFIGVS